MSLVWIGPYDSRLNGAYRLGFEVDGGRMYGVEVRTGFCTRGLEGAIEQRDWSMTVALAGRVDPDASFFGEWAASLVIESLMKIEIPARARALRLVAAELGRISSHLRSLALTAREAGSLPVYHYCLRNRERFLDLLENWTGARFNLHFCRPGGIARDLTDGVLEKTVQECEGIVGRVREINDLMTYSSVFMERSRRLASLDRLECQQAGVTGPMARACDVLLDSRADPLENLGYKDLEFAPVQGRGQGRGDVHDRFVLRVREILQSAEMVRSILAEVPRGAFWDDRAHGKFLVPSGEALEVVESPRGLLACYCASEGKSTPARMQFRTPSTAGFSVLPRLLEGVSLQDLSLVLHSLDLSAVEADR